MPIEKLKPSFTFTHEKLDELEKIVPEAFADGKINWSTLREALGDHLEEDERDAEHFGLFWPGKREARRHASTPSTGTLVPVKGEGINEDATGNIYIEGENLEVLKILRKSYSGRIKMIYIDPPYNTGNDFVYDDNFTEPLEEYLRRTGQTDEEGRALTTNKKSDGRFHSKWLSMMYPRLKLASELLRDDGVIFVSIGDNEVHNLRILMNDVFGEENYIATLVWNTEGNTDNQKQIKVNHEYIHLFCKDIVTINEAIGYVIDPNTREDSNLHKGYADNNITKNNVKNPPAKIILPSGFPSDVANISFQKENVDEEFFTISKEEKIISKKLQKKYNISRIPVKLDEMIISNYKLVKPVTIYGGYANLDKLKAYIDNNMQPLFENGDEIYFYLNRNGCVRYRKQRQRARNILSVVRGVGTTEKNRSLLRKEEIYFDYPKPIELVKYLIQIGCIHKDDVVLDFFSGSATSAHALLEINQEDGGNRRFLLVQIPEPTDIKSEAYNAGYKNIADIGKDRIRKAIKSLQSKNNSNSVDENNPPLPLEGDEEQEEDGLLPALGFKIFKLTHSNFKLWNNYHGEDIDVLEDLFVSQVTPLVDGWKEDDLFTEILLLEGFPLDSLVKPCPEYKKNTVREVSSSFCEHRLLISLDRKIDSSTINGLKLGESDIFICLDSAVQDAEKARLADKGLIKTI